MSDQLFISDLHLSPERPEMTDLFLKFMDEVAPRSKTLYVLGDFLEYWIGDDMDDIIQDTSIGNVFTAIKTLNNKGTEIYFMHGNRDFLVGNALAEKYHFTLIEDPSVIEINNEPVLLMHGDTLCTDDIEYQKFRLMVRDKKWQEDFLSNSLEERQQIIIKMREISKEAVASKNADIMDVNADAVNSAMSRNNVKTMIHGHTHRPAIHEFDFNGAAMQRYVLADWYDSGSYLEVSEGVYQIFDFC